MRHAITLVFNSIFGLRNQVNDELWPCPNFRKFLKAQVFQSAITNICSCGTVRNLAGGCKLHVWESCVWLVSKLGLCNGTAERNLLINDRNIRQVTQILVHFDPYSLSQYRKTKINYAPTIPTLHHKLLFEFNFWKK